MNGRKKETRLEKKAWQQTESRIVGGRDNKETYIEKWKDKYGIIETTET